MCRRAFWSITDSDDFVNRARILGRLDHEIGYIRTRDFETENGQAPLSHTILSGGGFVLLSSKMVSIASRT